MHAHVTQWRFFCAPRRSADGRDRWARCRHGPRCARRRHALTLPVARCSESSRRRAIPCICTRDCRESARGASGGWSACDRRRGCASVIESHRGGLLLPLLVAVYRFVYETYSSLSFHVRVTIIFITPSLITAGYNNTREMGVYVVYNTYTC